MREVIQIGVGQCGIKISEKYWEVLCDEVDLSNDGILVADSPTDYNPISNTSSSLANLNVHFTEVADQIYRARACFVDVSDSDALNGIENGPMRRLFSSPNSSLSSSSIRTKSMTSTKNIFARFNQGEEFKETLREFLSSEAERSDSIDSIQIAHSLCGGAGSGLGCQLIEESCHISDANPLVISFPQFPHSQATENLLEIYNTVLSLDSIIEFADMAFPFDNHSLYEISSHHRMSLTNTNKHTAAFDTCNFFLAHTIAGLSSGIRFPGQLNTSSRKLATNLIPFPRYSFILSQLFPLCGGFHARRQTNQFNAFSQSKEFDLVESLMREDSEFLRNVSGSEKVISLYGLFRGASLSTGEIEQGIQMLLDVRRKQAKEFSSNINGSGVTGGAGCMNNGGGNSNGLSGNGMSYGFGYGRSGGGLVGGGSSGNTGGGGGGNSSSGSGGGDQILSNVSLAFCNQAQRGHAHSVQVLKNHAGIFSVFSILINRFRQQFTRKSYLHYYLQEGMEEMQFQDALANLIETYIEYNQFSQDFLFNSDDSSVE